LIILTLKYLNGKAGTSVCKVAARDSCGLSPDDRTTSQDHPHQIPCTGVQSMSTALDEHTINNFVLVDESTVSMNEDTSNVDVRIASSFEIAQIRIASKPAQLDALIKRLKNNEIDLAPDFQRASNIWTAKARSRLIESFILRIPVPSFYFDATNENKWVVVDGLQRLTTINRFVVLEDFTLSDLEFLAEYNEKKFGDLPRNFRRNIEEAEITMYLIQEGTPDKVKYNLFKRINTGGQPLTSQEIRHALNPGVVMQFLKDMSKTEEFKQATANGISPLRMDDRECVLRFVAFVLTSPEDYDNDDFDAFLNTAMAKFNGLPEHERNTLGKLFLKAMRRAKDIFDNDAFRKRYNEDADRYPISKALFESWSVNLAQLSDIEEEHLVMKKSILKEKFIYLMNNDREFEVSITQGTGSVSRVKRRFKTIAALIQEVLDA
jgi:hypothetical protein